jgi:hypothetical protein
MALLLEGSSPKDAERACCTILQKTPDADEADAHISAIIFAGDGGTIAPSCA